MPIFTLLNGFRFPTSTTGVQFVDETGINPLPAGTIANVYAVSTVGSTNSLVATASLTAGGNASSISLQTGGSYTATFVGEQAPTVTASFTAAYSGLTVAIVNGYRSPTLSVSGYAAEMAALWPQGPAWFSDSARAPGGAAYAVGYGLAGQIANLDAAVQTELGRLRIQTCQGTDIDTWAADFLGQYLTRPATATDAQWYALIIACLQTPKCTLLGIQQIVTAWITFITAQYIRPTPLSLDNSGSLDGGDGFLDVTAVSAVAGYPVPYVFDAQSNPTLAAALSPAITLTSGKFCVYFRYPGYSDATIQIVAPLSALLSKIVNLWKASGTTPVYAANA